MRRYLKRRVPKIPNWRWIIVHRLRGLDISIPERYVEWVEKFLKFLDENLDDPEEALALSKVDLSLDVVEDALYLEQRAPMRNTRSSEAI